MNYNQKQIIEFINSEKIKSIYNINGYSYCNFSNTKKELKRSRKLSKCRY